MLKAMVTAPPQTAKSSIRLQEADFVADEAGARRRINPNKTSEKMDVSSAKLHGLIPTPKDSFANSDMEAKAAAEITTNK